MGFVDPPEISAEPDYDGDSDYEDDASERELMLDDLADDNEDFSRSNDEGCAAHIQSSTPSFCSKERLGSPPFKTNQVRATDSVR